MTFCYYENAHSTTNFINFHHLFFYYKQLLQCFQLFNNEAALFNFVLKGCQRWVGFNNTKGYGRRLYCSVRALLNACANLCPCEKHHSSLLWLVSTPCI